MIEDLIIYSVVTNFNNVPGSILNLIPIDYFEIKGVADEMHNLNWDNSDSSDAFVKQFIQNNPKYARRLPKALQLGDVSDIINLEGNDEFIVNKVYVPYISYYIDGEGYALYSHKGNGEYGRINLLGYKGTIKEFDSSIKNGTVLSSYEPNNVGVTSPDAVDNVETDPNNKQYPDLEEGTSKAYFVNYDDSSIQSLISTVGDDVENPSLKQVYTLLEDIIKDSDTDIVIVPNAELGAEGEYNPVTNTISMNDSLPKEVFERTLVEEVFHSILSDVIRNPNRTSAQEKLLSNIKGVQSRLNQELRKNKEKYSRFDEKLKLLRSLKSIEMMMLI